MNKTGSASEPIVAFYLEYYQVVNLYLYHWEGLTKQEIYSIDNFLYIWWMRDKTNIIHSTHNRDKSHDKDIYMISNDQSS
jgi:hypothetical protein